MIKTTRRGIIRTAGLGAAAAALSPFMGMARAASQAMFTPEAGAEISLLRWKRFVQSEEDAFLKIVADFTAKTGVKVNVASESLDDVQPKASVAANVGQGPDIVWGLYSLPHLFPDKLVDLTDLADSLGKAHGGWVEAASHIVSTPYKPKLFQQHISVAVDVCHLSKVCHQTDKHRH